MIRSVPILAALAAGLAGPALAQSPEIGASEQRETLLVLTMVNLTATRCDFAIEPEEQAAIDDTSGMVTALLGMSDTGIEMFVASVESAMEERGWDELCDPDGEWAAAYEAALRTLGQGG